MTNQETIEQLKLCKGYPAAREKAIEALALQDADGCEGCGFIGKRESEMPCTKCKRNYKDYWQNEEWMLWIKKRGKKNDKT